MDLVICMCNIYHIYYGTCCTDLTAFTQVTQKVICHVSLLIYVCNIWTKKKHKIKHMLWNVLLFLLPGLSLRYTSKSRQQKDSSSEKEASLRIAQDQSQWWVNFVSGCRCRCELIFFLGKNTWIMFKGNLTYIINSYFPVLYIAKFNYALCFQWSTGCIVDNINKTWICLLLFKCILLVAWVLFLFYFSSFS